VHGLLGEEDQDGRADVAATGPPATAVTAPVAARATEAGTEARAEAAAAEVGPVEAVTTEVVVVAPVPAA